jgi:hypothetical protein
MPDLSQQVEINQRVAEWRQKQEAGTMTPEDWRQAMLDLRAARSGAATRSAQARAARAPVNVEALKESLRALRKA